MTRPKKKLDLDPVTVRKARSLARKAGRPIVNLARQHTTVSVERAVLRLAGLTPRAFRGSTGSRTPSAPTSGWSTASPCRCGTRWCVARRKTSACWRRRLRRGP